MPDKGENVIMIRRPRIYIEWTTAVKKRYEKNPNARIFTQKKGDKLEECATCQYRIDYEAYPSWHNRIGFLSRCEACRKILKGDLVEATYKVKKPPIGKGGTPYKEKRYGQTIRKLRDEGKTIAEIAEYVPVSKPTITSILKAKKQSDN